MDLVHEANKKNGIGTYIKKKFMKIDIKQFFLSKFSFVAEINEFLKLREIF